MSLSEIKRSKYGKLFLILLIISLFNVGFVFTSAQDANADCAFCATEYPCFAGGCCCIGDCTCIAECIFCGCSYGTWNWADVCPGSGGE